MKIGIIGGSGLDNPELIANYQEKEVTTPFGAPSSPLTIGKINGVDVIIISRHGKKHQYPPTQVNNKANIFALKQEGCKAIIATTAVGSLREEIKRGDFIVLDQFIDLTRHRAVTFFDKFEFGPLHASLANPFCEELRLKLIEVCKKLNFNCHEKGTVITIEGPRFSTVAESKLFRQWGADVINMSIAPEAILAKEAEIDYAVIAMSTDYDCWKQDEIPVTWQDIKKTMQENSERVKKVLTEFIKLYAPKKENVGEGLTPELKAIKEKIRTIPDWPKPGVMFRDITTLLQDPAAMKIVIDKMYERYKNYGIDIVAAIESRGFILGAILAEKLNASFVPLRKPGKLPWQTEKQEYELEYGKDAIEIHKDAIKPGQMVLIVDDLIATGGTARAACELIERLGGQIVECSFVIELPDLKGKDKLSNWPVFSLIKFEGE